MRKFSIWIVIAVAASIGFMATIHERSISVVAARTSALQSLYIRQGAVDKLSLVLEHYRRLSATFRKMAPAEIAAAKSELQSAFRAGTSVFDSDGPTEERARAEKLNEQVLDLMKTSERIEPMLFSRDAYSKPEVRALHDGIVKTLSQVSAANQARIGRLSGGTAATVTRSFELMLLAGALILGLLAALLARGYIAFVRPLKALHGYAEGVRSRMIQPGRESPRLSGTHGEIEAALTYLGLQMDSHLRERHKFILDVVSDLRAPLGLLQSGKALLGEKGASDAAAADSIQRGLAILSGSLEDLSDVVDINRLEAKLEENVVDLSELISDVCRTLGGSGLGKRISVSVPPMPIWMQLDSRRMERVMMQAVTKVASTVRSGGIQVSVSQPAQGAFRGIEIGIQAHDPDKAKGARPQTGPELDVLKHWISESGISMALAHKVIKAQGGTMVASGVPGTSVQLSIRLPLERMASRGLISPPSGLEVNRAGPKGPSANVSL